MAAVVTASVDEVIVGLEQARRRIEHAIAAHVAAHPTLKQEMRLLMSVSGIGASNVLWLLVLVPRWDVLTGGQGRAKGFVAYVGLDPRPFESRTSARSRATISRMGAAHLRRRLFLSAFGRVRGNNPLRQFYQRLVAQKTHRRSTMTPSVS